MNRVGMTRCLDVGEIDAGSTARTFLRASHWSRGLIVTRGRIASVLIPGALEEVLRSAELGRFATVASEMVLVSRERLGDMRELMLEYQIKNRIGNDSLRTKVLRARARSVR